jgi:hypothetical protein
MATATATQTQRNGATAHETSPETMEAVITSGLLKGKIVQLTEAPNGAFSMGEPQLTPEEVEVLEAVVEASKKAEATAIRAGKLRNASSKECSV